MSAEPDGGLVKVRVALDGNGPHLFESFWAESLGDDLYRLDNFPFYAFDLHYRDVVQAITPDTSAFLTIVSVVQPSGHRTLRIFPDEQLDEAGRQHILETLTTAGAEYEGAYGRLYSINVPPEADYPAICDYLWRLEQAGHLVCETGTTRQETPDSDASGFNAD